MCDIGSWNGEVSFFDVSPVKKRDSHVGAREDDVTSTFGGGILKFKVYRMMGYCTCHDKAPHMLLSELSLKKVLMSSDDGCMQLIIRQLLCIRYPKCVQMVVFASVRAAPSLTVNC